MFLLYTKHNNSQLVWIVCYFVGTPQKKLTWLQPQHFTFPPAAGACDVAKLFHASAACCPTMGFVLMIWSKPNCLKLWTPQMWIWYRYIVTKVACTKLEENLTVGPAYDTMYFIFNAVWQLPIMCHLSSPFVITRMKTHPFSTWNWPEWLGIDEHHRWCLFWDDGFWIQWVNAWRFTKHIVLVWWIVDRPNNCKVLILGYFIGKIRTNTLVVAWIINNIYQHINDLLDNSRSQKCWDFNFVLHCVVLLIPTLGDWWLQPLGKNRPWCLRPRCWGDME